MTGYTLVTNWDEGFDPLGNLVYPRRQEYARRHGYGCVRFNHPGYWGKLKAILDAWDTADWLWWLDIDATITNLDTRLEPFTRAGDFVVTTDIYGLNAGSFLVKTNPAMKGLFNDCLAHQKVYEGPWHDNTALAFLLWPMKDRVQVVHQRAMNSYPDYKRGRPDEVWQPGDFVLHCPGLPMDQRLALLSGCQGTS